MTSRPFRLTYPCALAALALIVGGAPPSSGLIGCAAPPARSPEGASPASAGTAAFAPTPSGQAPLVALAPRASASAGAASETAGRLPNAAVEEPVAAPIPAPPALPPHVWKGNDFQRALNDFARWAKKNKGELGAELTDVASGAALGSVAANAPQNPASNQKVVTTAAVLAHLGADFRFKTTVCGTRSGDTVSALVLRGSGDPSLSSDDLKTMAKALAQAGIKRVTDLLLDQSYFDAHFVPPAFEQQPQEWAAFRAPVSALSLDRNVTTLNVAPTELGLPAKVWFDPEGFVDVTGSVRTDALRDARTAENAEHSQNVKLTLKESGTRLAALVAGTIAPGSPAFHWSRRVEDPMLLAGYGFKNALEAEGIQVSGKIAVGGEAERAELTAHESKPLSELLPELGKDSDNFYAETLLKDLGANVKGAPGTSANGAAVELEYLREIEAFDPGTRISNGSGLFDANRLSAHTLVKTLLHAYREPRTGGVFVAQLAVGGVDGTLKHRFAAFRKARSIHAKTGTLDRSIALSGFASRPDGSSPVAFSLIVSGISNHAEVRKRIDDVVSNLARALARDQPGKAQ
ncbi:MAG: D-alanyl-D-alanine carboxypeptidase/D-alanyl-D-alanine-endopeptidase [Pseudomonadota bacterium]